MTALIKYETACRSLAEAHSVDEVKSIRDKAEAMRVYAIQSKNVDLESMASEIRDRAERRLGELLIEAKKDGRLSPGQPKKNCTEKEQFSRIKLEDIGVDRKLSANAQKLAGIGEQAFEALIARKRQELADRRNRVANNIFREQEAERRKADHAARTFDGGNVDDLHKMIAEGRKFKTILADPPWHFLARSDKGEGRSAGQHYTTDRLGEITALPVAQLADEDTTLCMWMVDWCPTLALDVIEAWGFAHKTTAFTWAKQNASGEGWHMGQGYWTRANPEDCWLATRGHPKRMNADVRQLIVHPVMEHSRKPDEVHDRVERLLEGPYLELYARRERKGWITWGNELKFQMPDVADDGSPTDPITGEIAESVVSQNETTESNDDEIPAFLKGQGIPLVRGEP